jgi:hypothetical protein
MWRRRGIDEHEKADACDADSQHAGFHGARECNLSASDTHSFETMNQQRDEGDGGHRVGYGSGGRRQPEIMGEIQNGKRSSHEYAGHERGQERAENDQHDSAPRSIETARLRAQPVQRPRSHHCFRAVEHVLDDDLREG